MSKRRHHTAEFKAKVALDALKGIEPVHVIAARHGVPPTQVTVWFLGVPRAPHYYHPRLTSAQNLSLMRAVDELHLAYRQFGSRKLGIRGVLPVNPRALRHRAGS